MKRKVLLGLLLSAIAIFAFIACSNETPKEEDKGTAPIINEVLFINSSLDKCFSYTTYSADSKPTALTTLNTFAADDLHNMKTPPYYVYIAFTDNDKDIKTFDEVSIPNTGMKGTNEMPSANSYVIIPVGYTTTEIPSTKITNGKYTFKFQAIDSKGNKSEEFPVTISVSEK